ncbi:TonB-dependent receptor [Bordetella genomosp. 5]|uniref:TonB-dependent siderophore receptor n=1 Tax=Bordetella genomosp. 5 TaxID=1395608 RepID=A0A261T474_9BORD|nr:TonB-dependent receptor [Bordetella genomosp. 5]OZI44151.1 TonB-dependent siderophore receptor [Bordetella genomosp. 5]
MTSLHARTLVLPRRMRAWHACLPPTLVTLALTPTAGFAQSTEPSVATLPGITVAADADRPSLLDTTATGSLLDLTPFETPASVDIITSRQLRERAPRTIGDAISQAPGLSTMRHPGNGGAALSSRGFSDTNSVAQLYDGLRQYGGVGQTLVASPWAVERIEVLRGPASVIYGEGAIGGVVNVVPKKPTRGPIENEVETTFGTHDTQRVGIGSGGALDDRWSYRIDASAEHTHADMSLGGARNAALSAALRLDVNPDLNVTFTQVLGWQEPTRYFGTPLVDGTMDYGLRHQNYNVADATIIYRDNRSELRTEWTPNDSVLVRNRVYYQGSRRDWRNAEEYAWQPATGLIERSGYSNILHDQEQVGTVTDAVFKGSLLGLRNQFAVGLELNRASLKHTNNSPYGGASLVDPYDVDHGRFMNLAGTTPRYRNTARQLALYAEDRLALTPNWSVLGGLRYDHIELEQRNLVAGNTAYRTRFDNVGWRVGTVYDITPTTALYAQYAEAADPVGALLLLSPANQGFDLATGRQVEVGIKQTFWDARGEWTLAAYHIRKKNLLARDPDNPALRIQVGQQSSRGIEASLGVALTPTLRLDANATILQAQYDEYSESSGGRTVSRDGNVPTDVPERLANLWLSWKFAPQWTASAGVRYVGARYANAANTLEMAGYTTTNLALQWDARQDLTLAVRAYNVFDRQYAETAYYNQDQWLLGTGRRVELSAHYRF